MIFGLLLITLLLSQFISKSNILLESESQIYNFDDVQSAIKFAIGLNTNSSLFFENSFNSNTIKDQQIDINKSLLLEFFIFFLK